MVCGSLPRIIVPAQFLAQNNLALFALADATLLNATLIISPFH